MLICCQGWIKKYTDDFSYFENLGKQRRFVHFKKMIAWQPLLLESKPPEIKMLHESVHTHCKVFIIHPKMECDIQQQQGGTESLTAFLAACITGCSHTLRQDLIHYCMYSFNSSFHMFAKQIWGVSFTMMHIISQRWYKNFHLLRIFKYFGPYITMPTIYLTREKIKTNHEKHFQTQFLWVKVCSFFASPSIVSRVLASDYKCLPLDSRGSL